MKIYLDVCCLNRPFDNQTDDRIHLEAEAVITILKNIESGKWKLISSSILFYEINLTPDEERKQRVLALTTQSSCISLDEKIYYRSEILKRIGFKTYDALHIACAEQAKADIFLSTDDKLVIKAVH